jgi:hypothetical protein
LFDVGSSTCPQCLDGGVSLIQSFYLTADVSIIKMHYAWQAGVRRSIFLLSTSAYKQLEECKNN